MKFHANPVDYHNVVELYLIKTDRDGVRYVAEPADIIFPEEGIAALETVDGSGQDHAFIRISYDQAKSLYETLKLLYEPASLATAARQLADALTMGITGCCPECRTVSLEGIPNA